MKNEIEEMKNKISSLEKSVDFLKQKVASFEYFLGHSKFFVEEMDNYDKLLKINALEKH